MLVTVCHPCVPQAYLGVVGARTADDIFRILAVRMLDPLIFECLSFSLNMFRADKIVKEADKQSACVRLVLAATCCGARV